jgi:serine protease AprX
MKRTDSNRADDTVTTYSSRGPTLCDLTLKPDIVAPGNLIVSDQAPGGNLSIQYPNNREPLNDYTSKPNGYSAQYFVLSGTSMAAPVVSGCVALLLEKYPTLSPDTVKARLMLSADKWANPDGTTDPFTYGAGMIDIEAALKSTVVVPSGMYAFSPVVQASNDQNVYIDPNRAIWGNGSLWGTGTTDMRAILGNRAIWGNNAVVDQRAIWGNVSNVSDERAIWGNSTTASTPLTTFVINGDN